MARGKRAESTGFRKPRRSKAEKDAEALEAARAAQEEGGEESEETEAGPGHNGPPELTEDQRISLSFTHKRAYENALEMKKEAARSFLQVCKLAKAELGAEAVDDIKEMIALETEEGEKKFKANLERQIKVARWMGLPVGAEPKLFADVDRTPAVDKARANGKRDGLAGNRQSPNADPSTEQYRAYMEGFYEGNSVLAQGLAPKPAAAGNTMDDGLDGDGELDAMEPADNPPEPVMETAH